MFSKKYGPMQPPPAIICLSATLANSQQTCRGMRGMGLSSSGSREPACLPMWAYATRRRMMKSFEPLHRRPITGRRRTFWHGNRLAAIGLVRGCQIKNHDSPKDRHSVAGFTRLHPIARTCPACSPVLIYPAPTQVRPRGPNDLVLQQSPCTMNSGLRHCSRAKALAARTTGGKNQDTQRADSAGLSFWRPLRNPDAEETKAARCSSIQNRSRVPLSQQQNTIPPKRFVGNTATATGIRKKRHELHSLPLLRWQFLGRASKQFPDPNLHHLRGHCQRSHSGIERQQSAIRRWSRPFFRRRPKNPQGRSSACAKKR